jgi:hypothetical protein
MCQRNARVETRQETAPETITIANIRRPVEKLWKKRGMPVENGSRLIFFHCVRGVKRGCCTVLMRLRFSFRLNAFVDSLESRLV